MNFRRAILPYVAKCTCVGQDELFSITKSALFLEYGEMSAISAIGVGHDAKSSVLDQF